MSKNVILISQKISGLIHLQHYSEHEYLITEDILNSCYDMVRKYKTSLCLLICLADDEHTSVEDLLKDYAESQLHYEYILFQQKQSNIDPRLLKKIHSLRTGDLSGLELSFSANKVFQISTESQPQTAVSTEQMNELLDSQNDQEALIKIGKSLSLERNPDRLFKSILYICKKMTGADAGSIFIVEEDRDTKKKLLRFKYSHTFSKELNHYQEFTMPCDTNSIAGYVALTGRVLNIDDVYAIGKDTPFSFKRTYDEQNKYRTKSMLVVPMRGNLDRIIGVIQLINSKESMQNYTGNEAFEIILEKEEDFVAYVHPFPKRYESLMEAVAGQAAIALENNRMLKQIENQFEAFVLTSVYAIESRDPATSGHSSRVASMCVNTAKALSASSLPRFQGLNFSPTELKELHFAGLLHDYGKVYIDAKIFLKAKKLFDEDFANLMLRLALIYRSIELEFTEEILKTPSQTLSLQKKKAEKLDKVNSIIDNIIKLNEPSVMGQSPDEIIQDILDFNKDHEFSDLAGKKIPILTNQEIENLCIPRGSLNMQERKIIESHVMHTYEFVRKIPWPDEFKRIPEIAVKHHEMLDGSGYPHGLKGRKSIPAGARIMTIADIFDALSAADRPYKKAVPLERVFSILQEEADKGKLDKDILEIFVSNGCWKDCEK